MGAKAPSGAKNYYGHCAGILCQGQLDFISGLLINNTLEYPNAAVWDSQIFKAGRVIIYTDGNAYQNAAKSDQTPPNFPWTLYASAWVSGGGGYALGTLVVGDGAYIFQSLANSNTSTPPATAVSNSNWKYISTPDQWATIGTDKFWSAGSIVAWEGQVYTTAEGTNEEPPAPPWTLFQILRTASPNPLVMTVPKSTRFGQNSGPGTYYLYWGTPDQVLDPTGEGILTSLGNPPYRNCAVGKNILFGEQTLNPPSIQVLGGRAPVQSIITGPATALDSAWQANPWVVLAELLTHPIYGLGLPANWFDAATWNAEANRCYANTDLFYISPMYTSLKKVSELVADLMGYPDAFIFWSAIATLTAGHWPHGEAAPAFNATNTINRDNIIREFATSSEVWWGTANSVAVSIQDIQAAFKSRPCLAPNLFNMAVTRRLLTQKIDRPWITRYSEGLAWATEMVKILGDQSSNGTIEVQSEKTNVVPGSLFLLTDDQFGFSEVQRCTKKVISAPPTGTSKITHETERGVAPQPYSPTQQNPAPAAGPAPSVITNYQLVQLPTSLAGAGSTIAVLAGRPSAVTTALQVWFQQADASAYQLLGQQGIFAVAGTVEIDGGVQVPQLLTSNSQAGTTYPLASGYLAYNSGFVVYNSSGTLIGTSTSGGPGVTYVYGTDYTLDIINNTITLLPGTSIPNGSIISIAPAFGCVPTTSATQGNTYAIPTGWWAPYQVMRMTAAQVSAYTGGLGSGTLCTEGQDYLIDPVAGTFSVLTGGNILSGETVFVFFTGFMACAFAPNTPTNDLEDFSAPLTQDEINDDELLMFAFKASNPALFEIMSVTGIAAASTYPPQDFYTISLKRAQFGTQIGGNGTDFSAGDFFFIIRRAGLTPLSHQAFEGLELSNSTANFILAPQSAWVDASISDLYDPTNNPSGLSVNFSYTFANTFAPTVTWIALLDGGAGGTVISSFASAFATTDVFYFSFQLNAPPGAQVISASLIAGVGEQQVTLWSNVFTPSNQVNAAAQFSIPTQGLWTITLNVQCNDGSQTNAPLTLSGTPVQIRIGATYAPTPTLDGYTKVFKQITNLKFGVLPSGVTVLYQLQARGTAYNSSGWTTAGSLGGGLYGPVPNFQTGAKTLYAKCQESGATDSPVVSWNL